MYELVVIKNRVYLRHKKTLVLIFVGEVSKEWMKEIY